MSLVDQCLSRGHRPEIVLIDGGYGNNTSIFNQLKKRNLTYIGGLATLGKAITKKQDNIKEEIRLDQLAESISPPAFNLVQLSIKNAKKVWVATLEVQLITNVRSKNYSYRYGMLKVFLRPLILTIISLI